MLASFTREWRRRRSVHESLKCAFSRCTFFSISQGDLVVHEDRVSEKLNYNLQSSLSLSFFCMCDIGVIQIDCHR